jgi:hypothetical protein
MVEYFSQSFTKKKLNTSKFSSLVLNISKLKISYSSQVSSDKSNTLSFNVIQSNKWSYKKFKKISLIKVLTELTYFIGRKLINSNSYIYNSFLNRAHNNDLILNNPDQLHTIFVLKNMI